MERALFEQILERLPGPAVHASGAQLRMNAAAARLIGYSIDELATVEAWFAALYGNRQQEARQAVEQALDQGLLIPRTSTVKHKDGTRRDIELIVQGTRQESFWLLHDVTARRSAEEGLRRAQLRLHQARSIAGVATWDWDLESQATSWSPEMFALAGRHPALGAPSLEEFLSTLTAPDRSTVTEALERIGAGSTSERVTLRLRRPHGQERTLAGVLAPDVGGGRRVIGALWDVTELEEAWRAARRSAELAELFFNETADGIIFMTGDPIDDRGDPGQAVERAADKLRIAVINEAACSILARPRESLIGSTSTEWFGDPAKGRSALEAILTRGRFHDTARVIRGDGAAILLEGEYVALRDELGRFTGWFAVQRDITEKKRMEERLIASERMASIGTLAAGVAHEINNPLAFVAGNLEHVIEALKNRPTHQDAELVSALEDALAGASRVQRIVSDLRTFARPGTPAKERVSIIDLLESCLQLAASEIRDRAMVVREYHGTPIALADGGRVAQVLFNLILNAARAIPPGAASEHQVRVRVLAEPGQVAVEIADTGSGIPAELLPRIFEPFAGPNPHGPGGLSLAVSRAQIVEMGGALEVLTPTARGSTFRLTLPRYADSAAPESAPKAPAPAAKPERPRVLVIDDEPLLARALTRILAQRYQVEVRASAREALTLLLEGPGFDRILCDLMMPDMTGMDFYDRLAIERPAMLPKVVFLTGGAFGERAQQFLARVKNPVLEKPVSVEQLLSVLGQAAESG